MNIRPLEFNPPELTPQTQMKQAIAAVNAERRDFKLKEARQGKHSLNLDSGRDEDTRHHHGGHLHHNGDHTNSQFCEHQYKQSAASPQKTDESQIQRMSFNNEHQHFQNEFLARELAESCNVSVEKNIEHGTSDPAQVRRVAAALPKQSNINIQILGSIQSGYGFLPNFSQPNNQQHSQDATKLRIATIEQHREYINSGVRIKARSPTVKRDQVDLALMPVLEETIKKQSKSVNRARSSALSQRPKSRNVINLAQKEETAVSNDAATPASNLDLQAVVDTEQNAHNTEKDASFSGHLQPQSNEIKPKSVVSSRQNFKTIVSKQFTDETLLTAQPDNTRNKIQTPLSSNKRKSPTVGNLVVNFNSQSLYERYNKVLQKTPLGHDKDLNSVDLNLFDIMPQETRKLDPAASTLPLNLQLNSNFFTSKHASRKSINNKSKSPNNTNIAIIGLGSNQRRRMKSQTMTHHRPAGGSFPNPNATTAMSRRGVPPKMTGPRARLARLRIAEMTDETLNQPGFPVQTVQQDKRDSDQLHAAGSPLGNANNSGNRVINDQDGIMVTKTSHHNLASSCVQTQRGSTTLDLKQAQTTAGVKSNAAIHSRSGTPRENPQQMLNQTQSAPDTQPLVAPEDSPKPSMEQPPNMAGSRPPNLEHLLQLTETMSQGTQHRTSQTNVRNSLAYKENSALRKLSPGQSAKNVGQVNIHSGSRQLGVDSRNATRVDDLVKTAIMVGSRSNCDSLTVGSPVNSVILKPKGIEILASSSNENTNTNAPPQQTITVEEIKASNNINNGGNKSPISPIKVREGKRSPGLCGSKKHRGSMDDSKLNHYRENNLDAGEAETVNLKSGAVISQADMNGEVHSNSQGSGQVVTDVVTAGLFTSQNISEQHFQTHQMKKKDEQTGESASGGIVMGTFLATLKGANIAIDNQAEVIGIMTKDFSEKDVRVEVQARDGEAQMSSAAKEGTTEGNNSSPNKEQSPRKYRKKQETDLSISIATSELSNPEYLKNTLKDDNQVTLEGKEGGAAANFATNQGARQLFEDRNGTQRNLLAAVHKSAYEQNELSEICVQGVMHPQFAKMSTMKNIRHPDMILKKAYQVVDEQTEATQTDFAPIHLSTSPSAKKVFEMAGQLEEATQLIMQNKSNISDSIVQKAINQAISAEEKNSTKRSKLSSNARSPMHLTKNEPPMTYVQQFQHQLSQVLTQNPGSANVTSAINTDIMSPASPVNLLPAYLHPESLISEQYEQRQKSNSPKPNAIENNVQLQREQNLKSAAMRGQRIIFKTVDGKTHIVNPRIENAIVSPQLQGTIRLSGQSLRAVPLEERVQDAKKFTSGQSTKKFITVGGGTHLNGQQDDEITVIDSGTGCTPQMISHTSGDRIINLDEGNDVTSQLRPTFDKKQQDTLAHTARESKQDYPNVIDSRRLGSMSMDNESNQNSEKELKQVLLNDTASHSMHKADDLETVYINSTMRPHEGKDSTKVPHIIHQPNSFNAKTSDHLALHDITHHQQSIHVQQTTAQVDVNSQIQSSAGSDIYEIMRHKDAVGSKASLKNRAKMVTQPISLQNQYNVMHEEQRVSEQRVESELAHQKVSFMAGDVTRNNISDHSQPTDKRKSVHTQKGPVDKTGNSTIEEHGGVDLQNESAADDFLEAYHAAQHVVIEQNLRYDQQGNISDLMHHDKQSMATGNTGTVSDFALSQKMQSRLGMNAFSRLQQKNAALQSTEALSQPQHPQRIQVSRSIKRDKSQVQHGNTPTDRQVTFHKYRPKTGGDNTRNCRHHQTQSPLSAQSIDSNSPIGRKINFLNHRRREIAKQRQHATRNHVRIKTENVTHNHSPQKDQEHMETAKHHLFNNPSFFSSVSKKLGRAFSKDNTSLRMSLSMAKQMNNLYHTVANKQEPNTNQPYQILKSDSPTPLDIKEILEIDRVTTLQNKVSIKKQPKSNLRLHPKNSDLMRNHLDPATALINKYNSMHHHSGAKTPGAEQARKTGMGRVPQTDDTTTLDLKLTKQMTDSTIMGGAKRLKTANGATRNQKQMPMSTTNHLGTKQRGSVGGQDAVATAVTPGLSQSVELKKDLNGVPQQANGSKFQGASLNAKQYGMRIEIRGVPSNSLSKTGMGSQFNHETPGHRHPPAFAIKHAGQQRRQVPQSAKNGASVQVRQARQTEHALFSHEILVNDVCAAGKVTNYNMKLKQSLQNTNNKLKSFRHISGPTYSKGHRRNITTFLNSSSAMDLEQTQMETNLSMATSGGRHTQNRKKDRLLKQTLNYHMNKFTQDKTLQVDDVMMGSLEPSSPGHGLMGLTGGQNKMLVNALSTVQQKLSSQIML